MVVGRVASGPDRLARPRRNTEPCDAQAHLMFHGIPLAVLALQSWHCRLDPCSTKVRSMSRHVAPAHFEDRSSPHPCGIYGSARSAKMRDSTALNRRSLIRMRPEVQVLPGPQPAVTLVTRWSEPVRRAVYRTTPHNWPNFLRCHGPTPVLRAAPCHPYLRFGDEAAPGADTGRRGLGLPLPNGAGTGPVAEISRPGQPWWVYPSSSGYNHGWHAWRVG